MNGFHMLTHLEHSKIPLPPFDKLMTGFDRLRANGILECSTAVFRITESLVDITQAYEPDGVLSQRTMLLPYQ
jgi:hypothetical protein